MARRSAKSKSTRRKVALGLPPAEHQTRESNFARQMEEKVSAMAKALKGKRCDEAFANLIDVASYGGMAEAEAVGHGGDGRKYARRTVDSLDEFHKSCKVGG